jgi:hypothetical protein
VRLRPNRDSRIFLPYDVNPVTLFEGFTIPGKNARSQSLRLGRMKRSGKKGKRARAFDLSPANAPKIWTCPERPSSFQNPKIPLCGAFPAWFSP